MEESDTAKAHNKQLCAITPEGVAKMTPEETAAYKKSQEDYKTLTTEQQAQKELGKSATSPAALLETAERSPLGMPGSPHPAPSDAAIAVAVDAVGQPEPAQDHPTHTYARDTRRVAT